MLAARATQPQRDNIARQHLKFLFDTIFSLLKIIDEQLLLLPDDDYKKTLADIIRIRLRLPLANLDENAGRAVQQLRPTLAPREGHYPLGVR